MRLADIEPGNEASVTMLFEPFAACVRGCVSALFLGDLDERAQDRMLRLNPALPAIDVVEVAHHGSADQSARLYERVGASVGLIGVGRNNRYGHPTSALLNILRSRGTLAARTDEDGLVLVAPGTAPGSVVVWNEKTAVGGGY